MASRARLGVTVALATIASCALLGGAAAAAPLVEFSAGLAPGAVAGAPTTATVNFALSGTEYSGFPSPLSGLGFTLPLGASLATARPGCPLATLEPSGSGPAACPAGSLFGTGTFRAAVPIGGETVVETGTAALFAVKTGEVALYLFGHSPILLEVLNAGLTGSLSPGFGEGVSFAVASVEAVPGAGLTSIESLNLSFEALAPPSSSCVNGALSWLGRVTPQSSSEIHREAKSTCPQAPPPPAPSRASTPPTSAAPALSPLPAKFGLVFALGHRGRGHAQLNRISFSGLGPGYKIAYACAHCAGAHRSGTRRVNSRRYSWFIGNLAVSSRSTLTLTATAPTGNSRSYQLAFRPGSYTEPYALKREQCRRAAVVVSCAS